MPAKKAVLLHGPPGTGKTSAAYALASDLGSDIIELNASDARTKKIINRIVGSASTSAALSPGRDKIIVLDEVDGIHGKSDYGGMSALKKWVNASHQPLVLIANDPYSLPKDFRVLTEMVEFRKINSRTVIRILKELCKKEGIKTSEKVLKIIATNSGGDLRSAINDLQSLAEDKKKLAIRDLEVLKMRDSKIRIFDTLRMIFKTMSIDRAREAVFNSEEDHDTILKWIVENLPIEYEEPEDLKSAYDSVSRADVFLGRIKRRQDWSLLKYASDLMSAGVALSKKDTYKKFSRYQYPKTFIAIAQSRKKRATVATITEKMAKKCHGSKGLMEREFFSLLNTTFTKAPEAAAHIASQLELARDEINYFVSDEGAAKKIEKRAAEITAERIRRRLRSDKQVSLFEFGNKSPG